MKYPENMKRAAICVLLGGLCLLSGCSDAPSNTETEANYSVDIQVPFVRVSTAPEVANTDKELSVDPNGNVTIYDDSGIRNNDNNEILTSHSTYHSLKLGDSGDEVRTLQTRLRELGYFGGNVTGIFDTDTENAVRRFERYYGIMQTGLASATLQSHLYASGVPTYNSDAYNSAVKSHYNTLQMGSVGSDVYALQYRLRELGYPIEELTAVYDEQTAQAVAMFAQTNALSTGRVANIKMQTRLYSDSAVRLETSTEDDTSGDTLEMGATGVLVTQIQTRLHQLGYLESEPSGIYDAETVTAVRMFQRICGFEVTGSLPNYLQAVLLSEQAESYSFNSVTLDMAVGDKGLPVRRLQERLIALGYANGSATGNYDENTAEAVRLFQHYNNLEENGLAPEALQNYLFSDSALSYRQALRLLAGDVLMETATPAPAVEATPVPTMAYQTESRYATPEVYTGQNTPTPQPTAEAPAAALPTLSAESDAEEDNSTAFYVLPTATINTTPVPTVLPTPMPTPVVATEVFNYGNGSEGADITKLQKRLKNLGYNVKRNGKFDDQTEAAVKELQMHIGVTQSGVVSEQLYRFLFSDAAPAANVLMYRATQDYTALKKGDTGDAVVRLQNQLSRLGYMYIEDVEDAEGEFNQDTYLAVIDLQEAMGYTSIDGIASPEFQCFIFSEFNSQIKQ